mgnify:CR=1 FL=1
MESGKQFNALLQVLSGEQQVIQRTDQKAFTLIELLVVVAIIGILAAVGVVAYSGYTSGAKKSAAKSNHAAVLKFAAAEMKKCNINGGEGKAMKDSTGTEKLDCADVGTAAKVDAALIAALNDFKKSLGLKKLPKSGRLWTARRNSLFSNKLFFIN